MTLKPWRRHKAETGDTCEKLLHAPQVDTSHLRGWTRVFKEPKSSRSWNNCLTSRDLCYNHFRIRKQTYILIIFLYCFVLPVYHSIPLAEDNWNEYWGPKRWVSGYSTDCKSAKTWAHSPGTHGMTDVVMDICKPRTPMHPETTRWDSSW